jgi:maltooligosyltrehalose trehalohydrolase
MNFDRQEAAFNVALPSGGWRKLIDSADEEWAGLGSPLPERIETDQALTISGRSFALYEL